MGSFHAFPEGSTFLCLILHAHPSHTGHTTCTRAVQTHIHRHSKTATFNVFSKELET